MAGNTLNVVLGSGPVGMAVMDELVARGRRVIVANRSGKVKETLPVGVTVSKVDALDPAQLAALCADADVVFQCAQPAYTEWPEKFPPFIAAVIEGISRTNARLVVADNLYMYGPIDGKPIHEDLPHAAPTRKGRARTQVAKMILDAHKAGKIQATMGRASDFYGPRVLDSAMGEIVFAAALTGKAANLMGNLDLPHTYTYIRDFAWALVELSEHADAFGRAWHVPSAETITTKQFLKLIEDEIGRPIKTVVANRLMLRFIGLFNPMIREFVEMYYEFGEPFIVDHNQFAARFGVRTTPHQEAIRSTGDWYRAHVNL
jgi:nucleoside-diphosphate-sugar epimerase